MKKLGKKGKIIFYSCICISFLLIVTIMILATSKNSSFIEAENKDLSFELSQEENLNESAENIVQEQTQEEIQNSILENKQEEKNIATQKEDTSSKTQNVSKEVKTTTDKKTNAQTTTNVTASSKTSTASKTASTSNKEQSSVQTQSNTSNSSQSVKRLSQAEIDAEKAKYLNDIKSIAPNLHYVYSKRGQVFWPYRTSEISRFTSGMTFGTVYYYVETFVESGQEKFKYYIDWAG